MYCLRISTDAEFIPYSDSFKWNITDLTDFSTFFLRKRKTNWNKEGRNVGQLDISALQFHPQPELILQVLQVPWLSKAFDNPSRERGWMLMKPEGYIYNSPL